MKFYSEAQCKFSLLFALCVLFFAPASFAQETRHIAIVSRNEFVAMSSDEKGNAMHQWLNASRQNEVPAAIEEKAIAYYELNKIAPRVYQKLRILMQTITNEDLPVSNRVNACYFIIENYDAAIFPGILVQDILNELLKK